MSEYRLEYSRWFSRRYYYYLLIVIIHTSNKREVNYILFIEIQIVNKISVFFFEKVFN